jgi:hypothetical protein
MIAIDQSRDTSLSQATGRSSGSRATTTPDEPAGNLAAHSVYVRLEVKSCCKRSGDFDGSELDDYSR